MGRECYLTGKKNMVVNSVIRRGKARAVGGVGRKVTGVTKRVQRANLHKRRILEGGVVNEVWLSAAALRTLRKGAFMGYDCLWAKLLEVAESLKAA